MKILKFIKVALRRYFFLGVIVFLPLVVTVKFLFLVINFFDSILAVEHGRYLYLIPERFHPNNLLGFPIPGLGVAFSLICILVLGALSRNFFGKKLLRFGDAVMEKIPMARSIYKVVRDMLKTYATQGDHQFSKVLLVTFPHSESYTLAFLTGEASQQMQMGHKRMLSVFVPTTPNPTSGFLLFVPKDQVQELDLTIEQAFKLIISGGMVNPDELENSHER